MAIVVIKLISRPSVYELMATMTNYELMISFIVLLTREIKTGDGNLDIMKHFENMGYTIYTLLWISPVNDDKINEPESLVCADSSVRDSCIILCILFVLILLDVKKF